MKRFIVYGAFALVSAAFCDTAYAMLKDQDTAVSASTKKAQKTKSAANIKESDKEVKSLKRSKSAANIKESGKEAKSLKRSKSDSDLANSKSETGVLSSLSDSEKGLISEMEKTQIPSKEVPKLFKNPDVLKAFIASLGHNYQGIFYNMILDIRSVKKNISSTNSFGKENTSALVNALSGLEDLLTAATHQQKNDIGKCDKKTDDLLGKAKTSINTIVSLLELPALEDLQESDGTTDAKARELAQRNAGVVGLLGTIFDDANVFVETVTAAKTSATSSGPDSVDDDTIKNISDSATKLKKDVDELQKAASKRKSAKTSVAKETEAINKKKTEIKLITEKSVDSIKGAGEELTDLLNKISLVMKLSRENFENLHQIADEGKVASRLVFKNLELYRKWFEASLLKLLKAIGDKYGFTDTGDTATGDESSPSSAAETEEEAQSDEEETEAE
ncbi:MAG: hypothetical protein LBT67_01725 [Holosporaceae bacterium]|jgi:hypothetical protein|nr:hypothetical protein [Holosporaceae bacterium]